MGHRSFYSIRRAVVACFFRSAPARFFLKLISKSPADTLKVLAKHGFLRLKFNPICNGLFLGAARAQGMTIFFA